MSDVSRRAWRLLAAAATTGVTVGAVAVGGAAAASADPATDTGPPKVSAKDVLGAHDRDLLAQAEAKGVKRVTILVAADKGRAAAVGAELAKLGGTVANRVDAVGYVRASMPTSAVLRAAAVPGIAAVDLNETIKEPAPDLGTGGAAAAQAELLPAPGPTTPAANPYMPTNETGAVAFKQRHPTWDGRGVTIGILDAGIDLDNPALQTTSTGQRKIVDWVTATDPVFDGDATWRAMITEVTGPTFTFAGESWTAPAGTWRVNRFTESITAPSAPGGDVNRDGDTADRFGVLYDPVSHDVRVDVNQNHDFTDDAVMRPYRERFDVGHFGTDDPATEVREQMPFTVEYREDVDTAPVGGPGLVDYVNIGIIEEQHGSHVAGIAAANDMLGNADFDGAAPGAKLVSSRACNWGGGCTTAATTDGMVDLVVNRHVDVVNMSIGGLPALNDGANARAELYNRLIRDFGVQIFLSAGNSGPGANTVGDPAVATDAVASASSISKQTWLANYGSETRTAMQLHNFSSRGPREDGGAKPNVAAPGSALSTTPLWQPGGPVPEAGYSLPPGLQMLNGTSMASPQSAGAGALLLSAAKATDRGVTPAALRRALYSSAKWIPGVEAYGQGNGLVNVPGAWSLLAQNISTRSYRTDAPVCTPLSDFLVVPDRGTGIYNRCAADAGGHAPGQPKSYPVTITRTTGPAGNLAHKLIWVGNDGTFSSVGQVVLRRNVPVQVVVQARPTAGSHSAILRVDDPSTPAVDAEMMAAVIAGSTPAGPQYAYAMQGSVDRNLYKSSFVTVPAGAKALQVNLTGIATGSQTRFIAVNPWGVPVESTASTACYTNFSDAAACNPNSRAYLNPIPGVWEIEVEARRTSPALENPFQIGARIQGVTVTPAVVELPSVAAGVPTPVTWTLTNDFGTVQVHGRGGPLGSSFSDRPTIATGELDQYQVVVPAGATRLDVSIGNTSDPAADLDLYLLRNGVRVAQSADGDSEESVSLANPTAGTYTVQVVGFAVPAGSTGYDYRDVFYSPALGSVDVPATTVTLANGASATITGSVTALVAPAAGRQLFGEMTVVTDEGAIVGRGAVRIGAVTAA
ncbi:MAG: S8 family serine peptidase [Mycobacteriales bacterium]